MQMFDRLAPVVALVGNYAISVFKAELISHLAYFIKTSAHDLRVGFGHIAHAFEVLFGNSQKMNFCLRIDILDYYHFFVFVNLFGGYLARRYFTEYAV